MINSLTRQAVGGTHMLLHNLYVFTMLGYLTLFKLFNSEHAVIELRQGLLEMMMILIDWGVDL